MNTIVDAFAGSYVRSMKPTRAETTEKRTRVQELRPGFVEEVAGRDGASKSANVGGLPPGFLYRFAPLGLVVRAVATGVGSHGCRPRRPVDRTQARPFIDAASIEPSRPTPHLIPFPATSLDVRPPAEASVPARDGVARRNRRPRRRWPRPFCSAWTKGRRWGPLPTAPSHRHVLALDHELGPSTARNRRRWSSPSWADEG